MASKKKRSNIKANGNATKKAKISEGNGHVNFEDMDLTSPRKFLEKLIQPTTFDNFFDLNWEKKPLILNRNNSSISKLYSKLFSKDIFLSLAKEVSLEFGTDVNVVKYIDKNRVNMNDGKRATPATIKKLFQSGGTFQIHQPQRFQESLRIMLERLECFFGCLVGANVYITPPGCQGLPPHHDDVEVFILQLEGEKRWKLHKPLIELPMAYSRDLTDEEIGEPTHDFVLKTGDLLYFPRGTIHHAVASGDSYSTHVTISTYQHFTWGNYLMSVFPSLVQAAMQNDVRFRTGLPISFFQSSKSQEDQTKSVVEGLLKSLKYSQCAAPDGMVEDFMFNRLPPAGVDPDLVNTALEGMPPTLNSQIKLKYPDHVNFLVKADNTPDYNFEAGSDSSDSEADESSDDESNNERPIMDVNDREMLYVYSSVFNQYSTHMMGKEPDVEGEQRGLGLKFPKNYFDAMEQLKANSETYTKTKDLKLTEDSDKENLARTLWLSHLLEVK